MIAVLFLAIDTNTIFTSASLYSDNLFVALLWASLYYYLYGLKQEKVKSLLFAGILLALAALTRPVAQYYFLLLLLFALLWPKKNIVLKLKHIFLYGIAFAVILSPWLYRNYDLYQTAKLSSIQGDNLLFWQTTYIRASETHQPGNVVAAEFMSEAKSLGYIEGGNPFVNESITQKIAVQYIKSRPLLAAKRWLSGMIHVYTNLNTGNIVMTLGLKPTALPNDAMATSKSELGLFALFFKVKSVPEIVAGLIVILLLLVNYSTFLLGSWLLLKRHQFVIWGMFIISIMYFTFTGGPIGLARFRLPVAPFYLLIGAVYIDQFLARRKLKDNY